MSTARFERHPKAKKRGQPALTAAGSNRIMSRRRYVLAAKKRIVQAKRRVIAPKVVSRNRRPNR
jgi:hypothetical protein